MHFSIFKRQASTSTILLAFHGASVIPMEIFFWVILGATFIWLGAVLKLGNMFKKMGF